METFITSAQAICPDCGESYDYESIMIGTVDFGRLCQPRCNDCAAALEHAAALRDREERRAIREACIQATIPEDLRMTSEDFPGYNRNLHRAVTRWRPFANERDFWLGIVGPADRCKTRCMAMLAMKAIRAGIRVKWTTANQLRDAVSDRNSSIKPAAIAARELLADCRNAAWLFIDDIGKNEWSPAFESQFFQILDHRKTNRLPLVYSSNIQPSGLGPLISTHNREPITGRLEDRTTLIELT